MPLRPQTYDYAAGADEELVALAQRGDGLAFGAVMQRFNQPLFRVARAIVRSDVEAEDVLQEAYVRAFAALAQYRGEGSLRTWLTRIVINEARGRLRKRRRIVDLEEIDAAQQAGQVVRFPGGSLMADPEAEAARIETRKLIERAVDQLPEGFRVVFLLREVEDYSVEDTAAMLALNPTTVKTRLHRARRMLRDALHAQLGASLKDTFPFLGERCDRMRHAVLVRLGLKVLKFPT